jgi:hypothetical protein
MASLTPTHEQIEEARKKLEEISNAKCFTLGGTYLQELFPLKATKDIDLVVSIDESSYTSEMENKIVEQLAALNYKYVQGTRNPWRFVSAGEESTRLDVFIRDVSDFKITNSMIKRSTAGRLAYEDYLLLKIQTTRDDPKDITDIIFLLQNIPKRDFNWKVFFNELKAQLSEYLEKEGGEVVLGRVIEIGYKLEYIKEREPSLIPDSTITQINGIYDYFGSFARIETDVTVKESKVKAPTILSDKPTPDESICDRCGKPLSNPTYHRWYTRRGRKKFFCLTKRET